MNKILNLYFVLGGAVSAGAYTAGVLDYFMSRLKEYMALDKANREFDIKVKAIAGTSAGGMCGSILLHSLVQGYPGSPGESALYRTWVEEIDISGLSGMSDLEAGSDPKALLNGLKLEEIAEKVLGSMPNGFEFEPVSFLSEDCKLILSVTDTVGKSYAIDFINNKKVKSYFTTNHRDYYHFVLSRPEENEIELNNGDAWEKLKKVSIATGAFPIGLPPVELTRDSSVYDHHEYDLGKPFNIVGNTHTYHGIDGGIGDNEPFGRLAGIIERDQRESNEKAAIVFIDPFPSGNEKKRGDSIGVQLKRLYTVFRNQSAYKPGEIEDFRNGGYSCYAIIPKRSGNQEIESHLAGAQVGAFSGFIHRDFRHHDYRLGIRNCQKFLRDHFPYFKNLPAGDPEAAAGWPAIGKREYRRKTRALDIRLAHIAGTFVNGFWGWLLKVVIRRIKKPSNLILKELEEHGQVMK